MKYKHLTREERHTISCLRRQAYSTAQIAEAVSKHPSTIRREFKRNPSYAGKYDFRQAHIQARRRSRSASCRAARINPESWAFALDKLKNEQWSPDQISAELAKQGRPTISHEAIYLRIYADRMRCGKLHTHLRHRVKSYRSRALKNEKRGSIKNQRSIDERPEIVEAKTRIGDWEIDTIIGTHSGSASVLVTAVERFSRYTLITKAANKSAEAVTKALLSALAPHRKRVHTLTYDNGKEFSSHQIIDSFLGSKGYFAHPYSSWERGLNENTNGLIRQYFPKKTNFNHISEKQIRIVQDKLNNRPRRCLDRNTPNFIYLSN